MKIIIYAGIALLSLSALVSQCQISSLGKQHGGKMKTPDQVNAAGQDPLDLPVENKVGGEYMEAFLASQHAFQADSEIPPQMKRIENYNIEFRQNSKFYFVFWSAKRLASERDLEGGASVLGKDVMYTISKKDYKVIERTFYK
jgi:hypothetical protein